MAKLALLVNIHLLMGSNSFEKIRDSMYLGISQKLQSLVLRLAILRLRLRSLVTIIGPYHVHRNANPGS